MADPRVYVLAGVAIVYAAMWLTAPMIMNVLVTWANRPAWPVARRHGRGVRCGSCPDTTKAGHLAVTGLSGTTVGSSRIDPIPYPDQRAKD